MSRASLLVLSVVLFVSPALARPLADSLARAGDNRAQIEEALDRVPASQRTAMVWLIEHMPVIDLESLSADYLLENVDLAWLAWRSAPWHDQVPEEVFLEAILPHASINERRDAWRGPFHAQFAPLVEGARTPGEAAAILNNQVFGIVDVHYSTKRPKADQSPMESIEAGMASCTGLSVLLIDACRSVGVPARFVGTPLWTDGSGNHSWVEVWHDGDWHFTGAAEPTGENLNRAWFTERASGAIEGDPRHAIFAATWREVPSHFPMSWRPSDTTVGGIDVTSRYAHKDQPLPDGHGWLRVRVNGDDGQRRALPVQVLGQDGAALASGMSRDERFDANDHFKTVVSLGRPVQVVCDATVHTVTPSSQQELVTLSVPRDQPLAEETAARIRRTVIASSLNRDKDPAETVIESGVISEAGMEMPFTVRVHGERPENGRSLFISLHGGGGAPATVNDRQWRNQGSMYPNIAEGIYVAPRAPTDTWNLWHQSHIDPLFDALIAAMIAGHDVDPDRVYLLGYSAGGDGVYQVAPRMADRFAAAAALAGHPNETAHDGLRNLPFTIHMGADDAAYNRNAVAHEWKTRLAQARAADPGGYPHEVSIHEGLGHWMQNRDRAAIDWMTAHRRDARPARIVWKQDDVLGHRFYWLTRPDPTPREVLDVAVSDQEVVINEATHGGTLGILLDDELVDMDRPVRVLMADGTVLFEGVVPRTRAVIERTMAERGDPRGVYLGEILVDLPSMGG